MSSKARVLRSIGAHGPRQTQEKEDKGKARKGLATGRKFRSTFTWFIVHVHFEEFLL